MRKRTNFSWLCMSAILLVTSCLCSCRPSPKGCVITGQVKAGGYEGRMVCLCDPYTHAVLDSVSVRDGKFRFIPKDSVEDVLQLRLKLSDDDLFPITLPVVTEKGTVRTVLGELVLTSGTPLNDALQDFLLAVDRFSGEMAKSGKEAAEMRREFMHLLETSILQNRSNPIGVYIFRTYSNRLTSERRAAVLEKAGEEFRKKIE
ncbi:DUF4369 domain-containing protein [uncultured Phocaeicola sp.]|uniref:DUF4369 domain-containing protein n=1 Tax=uncultured Phocaeicola sp. TaxID=990718 RepID=UPI001433B708|nr:DUF4369 domain-containing protein [uncultured Phocaeicola sp.]GFH97993.1 hypothetical protein IMSAGC004_00377 [Bacteroidaceae bacterium]